MLYDDILSQRRFVAPITKPEYAKVITIDFTKNMKIAQSFVLSRELYNFAIEWNKNGTLAEASKHLYKLPYDVMWLEAPMVARTKRINSADYDTATVNGRMGALLMYESPLDTMYDVKKQQFDGKGITAYLFSALKKDIQFMQVVRILPETARNKDGAFSVTIQYGSLVEPRYLIDAQNQASAAVEEICAYLAFINSPIVVDINKVVLADEAKNRRRKQMGLKMLNSYHQVELKKHVSQNVRESERGSDGVKRLHWVRGHFKARKIGLFWWNAHLAGKKELGMVEKDYVAN